MKSPKPSVATAALLSRIAVEHARLGASAHRVQAGIGDLVATTTGAPSDAIIALQDIDQIGQVLEDLEKILGLMAEDANDELLKQAVRLESLAERLWPERTAGSGL